MLKLLIVSLLLVTSVSVRAQEINSATLEARFLSDIQCSEAVQTQLKALGVTREWSLSSMREEDGSWRIFSPTNIIGVWVEARIFLNKEVVLRKLTDNFVETRTFDLSTCKGKQVAQKRQRIYEEPTEAGPLFNDRNLRDLLKKNKRGVIYVWSPNMPYSYMPVHSKNTGIDNLHQAAEKLKLNVTVLLDPSADLDYANQIIKEQKGLRPEYARRAQSLELGMRAMGNHYPVLVVYANGKLARFVYPGVGTAEEYAQYLQGQLNGLQ